ncbi:MAG: YitT family protein [Clostridia bacterium]|nr:YitT family protein [Clostridia bacterium]
MKNTAKEIMLRYAAIIAGCLVYAAGIAIFLDPNGLAPGGVTGIAIMISYAAKIPTGTLVLIINIPLLIIGAWKFGRNFLMYTAVSTVLSSLMINWLSAISLGITDKLLCGIVGGALMAVGMGIVFKCGGTTGGSDILIKLLRLRYRHLRTGTLFAITDTIIVAVSALVFKNIQNALYAGIALAVSSMVLDLVLYGPDEAKSVMIISDRSEDVAKRILEELDIGVTYLQGRGAYTGAEKQVLLCAMRKALFPKVRQVVQQEDPAAFMIVSSATEIFGEGFKDHFTEEI